MDLLVFSLPYSIRCTSFLNEILVLMAADDHLSVFDITEAKQILNKPYETDICSPISIIPHQQNKQQKIFTVQGKMGVNAVYRFSFTNNLLEKMCEYQSGNFGFMKMNLFRREYLLGVDEEESCFVVFEVEKGKKIHQWKFQEKKNSVGITCLQTDLDEGILKVFTGQQGWKINMFVFQWDQSQKMGEYPIEIGQVSSLTLKPSRNQETKIITGLKTHQKILYTTLRNDPTIYLISHQKQLQIITKIDTNLKSIRNLTILHSQLLIFSEANKIYTMEIKDISKEGAMKKVIKSRGELEQSKMINCLEFYEGYVTGSTEEKQIFHLELNS